MSKISLAETTIGKNTNIKNYGRESGKFLIDNEHLITLDKDIERRILNTNNNLMNSILGELYQQAIAENRLGIFTLLDMTRVKNLPSWFLITWLDIDILSLKDIDPSGYKTISSISKYRDQILLDITPHISKNNKAVKDLSGLQFKVIRDLLCRNYLLFDSLWLSPNLIYHLTKIYCRILSSKIGRTYNLSFQETSTVATAIAIFFTNRCADIKDTINPIMHKMDFLNRAIDTKVVFEYVSEKYDVESYDINAMIETIVALGPSRLSKLTASTFFNMNTNLAGSQIVSLVNLEYPPYFTASLLGALSGDKSSIYHLLKSLDLKKDADLFSKEILRTNSFIKSMY